MPRFRRFLSLTVQNGRFLDSFGPIWNEGPRKPTVWKTQLCSQDLVMPAVAEHANGGFTKLQRV